MYMEKSTLRLLLVRMFILFYFFASSLELLMELLLLYERAAHAGAVGCFSKLFSCSLRCTCGFGDNAAGSHQKESGSEGTFPKETAVFTA